MAFIDTNLAFAWVESLFQDVLEWTCSYFRIVVHELVSVSGD